MTLDEKLMKKKKKKGAKPKAVATEGRWSIRQISKF